MLKAKIVNGELFVERDGEFIRQICPRANGEFVPRICNYECPLFGEVIDQTSVGVDNYGNAEYKPNGRKQLFICEGVTFEAVE